MFTKISYAKYETSLQNNLYQNSSNFIDIPKFKPAKHVVKLEDNGIKIFEKDINNLKNRIEYENLKSFLKSKKEAIVEFSKIKFSNLSKTDISSFKKQLQLVKSTEGSIQLEKIIKTAKENDKNELTYKIATNAYLILGTLFGFILFKFYTKKYLYRMTYVEEIPNSLDDEQTFEKEDIEISEESMWANTQIISGIEFTDATLSQTLTLAQQDFIENNDDLIFSGLEEKEK